MVRPTSGLSETTTQHFLLDAGAVYLNLGETDERLLGATQGGSTFTIDQDVKVIELDGNRGNVRGARRIITTNATLVSTLIEMTTANLLLAIAGSSATDWTDPTDTGATAPTHDQIRRTRDLSDLDYLTNVALVARMSGTSENVIIMVYNAVADQKVEMKFEDKNETALEITFTAHYDPTDALTEPWAIYLPKDATA